MVITISGSVLCIPQARALFQSMLSPDPLTPTLLSLLHRRQAQPYLWLLCFWEVKIPKEKNEGEARVECTQSEPCRRLEANGFTNLEFSFPSGIGTP